jgi:hypothetical protein
VKGRGSGPAGSDNGWFCQKGREIAYRRLQIQRGLGTYERDVGNVVGAVGAGSVVAILLAVAADRRGRRRLLLLTILGFTTGTTLAAFAQTALHFTVLQFLARAFVTAEKLLALVVIAEELGAQRRGFGLSGRALPPSTGRSLTEPVLIGCAENAASLSCALGGRPPPVPSSSRSASGAEPVMRTVPSWTPRWWWCAQRVVRFSGASGPPPSGTRCGARAGSAASYSPGPYSASRPARRSRGACADSAAARGRRPPAHQGVVEHRLEPLRLRRQTPRSPLLGPPHAAELPGNSIFPSTGVRINAGGWCERRMCG